MEDVFGGAAVDDGEDFAARCVHCVVRVICKVCDHVGGRRKAVSWEAGLVLVSRAILGFQSIDRLEAQSRGRLEGRDFRNKEHATKGHKLV